MFLRVTEETMRSVLESGRIVPTWSGGQRTELVAEWPVKDKPMRVRVYTSVARGLTRDIGKDAIRVCLVSDEGKGLMRLPHIKRTTGWDERLKERVRAAFLRARSMPICPACSAPMALRTVKAGDRAGSKFYGCVKYPVCRETAPHRD